MKCFEKYLMMLFAIWMHCGMVRGAEWVSYTVSEGQFTASFPAKPIDTIVSTKVGAFTIPVHKLSASGDRGVEFTLIWNDYPQQATAATTPERILENIARGYEVPGKKIASNKTITISGATARELEVEIGGGRIHRAQFIMSGNRLFQLLTYQSDTKRDDPDVAKFFSGFSMWPKLDFPAGGFRIDGVNPSGWTPAKPVGPNIVTAWTIPNSGGVQSPVKLSITVAPAKLPTARSMADAMAAKMPSKVLPEPIQLDGETAFRLEMLENGQDRNAVSAVFTIRFGCGYLLMMGPTSQHDVHELVDQIIKGWKWTRMVPPSERLDLSAVPTPIFGGVASVNFPEGMYEQKVDDGDREFDLVLYDISNNKGILSAYLQRITLAQGVDFDWAKDDLLKKMNGEKKYDDQLSWIARNGDRERLVTVWSYSTGATKLGNGDSYVKLALIKLDARNMIMISFLSVAQNPMEKDRFGIATDKIVDSIRAAAVVTKPSGK